MSESKLIELGYYDPSAKIRLSAYADMAGYIATERPHISSGQKMRRSLTSL